MKLTFWLPRIVSLLFIFFLSLFALDVFSEPNWPIALFMHLIPSFVFLFLTFFSWHHELIGGFLFLVTSFITAIFFHSALIAVPAAIIGVLFFVSEGFFLSSHR